MARRKNYGFERAERARTKAAKKEAKKEAKAAAKEDKEPGEMEGSDVGEADLETTGASEPQDPDGRDA